MKQYLDQQGVEYLWGRIKRNFANLSNNGKVPASQLPSYVDDVEEYESLSSFPSQGEEGKIYVAKNTNLTYRWSGSTYVEISQSIALGETSNTAYPGDKGKQLEDSLDAEINRAKFEEADIRAAITAEQNRAEASERDNRSLIDKNTNDIVKEINNRVTGDESLSASINAETLARQDADSAEKLAREQADATEKAERQSEDNLIRAKIEQEQTRAEDAERLISNNLINEIDRAKAAEQQEAKSRSDADDAIKALLNTEVSRAKSEESKITASLATEVSRATTAENGLSDRITAEQNRATAAEGTLTDNLNSEISDRKEAIKAESDRAKAAEQALQAKVGSITIAKVTPHDSTTAVSYQLQVNGEAKGVTIDIAKDQSIKDIEVLDMNATLNDDGTIQAGSPVGSTALCISYILSDGTYKLAKLDYSKFLEETEFANGLEVNEHKVYVKVDPLSENFLSVSSTGVKITGVQNAINAAVDVEKAAREAADTEIKNSITQSGQSSTAALNAEIKRAKEAEATITSNLSRHTSDYENPHHVTKAQVGLDNVDNTADINKPISTATQNALNLKADANKYLPLTGGTLTGDLTSPKYVKTGGTNEQILLADGTVATPISADTLNLILT